MRRNYGENREKTVPVALRISESLAAKIEDYWKKNGMSSRSELIETAAEVYITSQKCPKCGAINPANGIRCSVCGENIGEVRKLIDEGDDLIKKIEEIVPPLRQKYNLCYSSIKAMNLKDIFLLRRFDMITARLGDTNAELNASIAKGVDGKGNKVFSANENLKNLKYFVDAPKQSGSPDKKEIDYNCLRVVDSLDLFLWKCVFEGIKNNNEGDASPNNHLALKMLDENGGRKDLVLTTINNTFRNILNKYEDISQELDQISEYLTQITKEREAAENKEGK